MVTRTAPRWTGLGTKMKDRGDDGSDDDDDSDDGDFGGEEEDGMGR